jgi:hypothetical protein
MDLTATGTLVKVATDGPQIDGIVFETPSASKVVVAVIDRTRGPVLRTVEQTALSERTEEGPDDRALQLLVKRTSPASRGSARGGARTGPGRAGHTRSATHRPTGR